MSFNKYYIQEPAVFAELVKSVGPKSIANRKVDALIGSSKSIQMFEFISESIYLGLSEAEVIEELGKKYPTYFGESN
jgi:hypothetical protein